MDKWAKLISPIDPELAGVVSLDKVAASRDGSRFTICMTSQRLLTGNEFTNLEAVFRKAFTKANVKLRVSYPMLKESVLSDVQSVRKFVTGLIVNDYPGALAYLKSGDDWRLDSGKLTIKVSDQFGVDYITRQNIDGGMARLFKSLFDVDLSVVVEISGDTEKRIRDISKKREDEAKRISEAAARDVNRAQATAEKPPSEQALGKPITDDEIPISELAEGKGRQVVKGQVISFEEKEISGGATILVTFGITDFTSSVSCKVFIGGKRAKASPAEVKAQFDNLAGQCKIGSWVKVRGDYAYDEFVREQVIRAVDIMKISIPQREDTALDKRVELHMHTQMSTMDACASAGDLIAQAARWGHKAVAITDHGVVQAFPEAYSAAKKNNIKLIPGCEGYLIADRAMLVERADSRRISDATFVVFDLETTGLNSQTDAILEIGAVKYVGGKEVAEFSQLINPGRPIPEKIIGITGINDVMVMNMPGINDVINDFHEFCKGSVMCAHNASFDWGFITKAFSHSGLDYTNPLLDTLSMSRCVLKGQKSHKLGAICKTLGVSLKDAHRAVHDARATAKAMMLMLEKVTATNLCDLNDVFDGEETSSYHIILLAKNQTGMTNLYRLISEAHLKHFKRTPRMPRSVINEYREGLIIGSACEAGELYRAAVQGKSWPELKRIASFYDYLEIQPRGNNAFLVREGILPNEAAIEEINRKIVRLGDELGKPVVATGDVHFKEPHDAIYRAILMTAKEFDDADMQPPLYFRTTNDMLEEFSYLGKDVARRVVVEAPNAIADMVGKTTVFLPHPEGKETFQPYWDYAEGDIKRLTYEKTHGIYGDPLPDIVQKRIDKELGSIIGYGFSTLYDIAVKLVSKSMSDGYIVGSRGSVGSSFVAWATGITEVNSLPPHYVCPKCKYSDFDVDVEKYSCGLDLPEKDCPKCSSAMNRDGFNIPFEVFLGFKGDKVPDIDLNFSGEYQPRAHAYVKELFGTDNVFRAGTIGTVADKTAFGYVLKYLEKHNKTAPNAEKWRLAYGCTGVKRTTGQHPAGMVVLPKDYQIYQFTAIQHPADDMQSETITTHFDFSSMHDVLVKLDILGHDDPTMLKKLQDMTGIAPQKVPLHDPKVFANIISLFTGTTALGISADDLGVKTGTLGVPEFGTRFVRQMLMDTKPSSMEELIRISGLSHGTDVWIGNAAEIIKAGIAPLRKCVCTRDDIMNQLIAQGVESKMAFTIMESVRKGKGLKPEMEKAMTDAQTPEWFIDCCKKIKYMFPKAHAVAYVTMALRIAYFKIFYPTQYYACFLMRNRESFDALRMIGDVDYLRHLKEDLQKQAEEKDKGAKTEDELSLVEILIEMALRGIKILPMSLYESHPADFLVMGEKEILPPLSSIPGLGLSAAENLAAARQGGRFISREDMINRKVPKGVVDAMAQAGALGNMPMTSQVSLFEELA